MSYDKTAIIEILTMRDGLDRDQAQDLVNQCQADITAAVEESDEPSLQDLEDILFDYFGLEPDFLDDFLPY